MLRLVIGSRRFSLVRGDPSLGGIAALLFFLRLNFKSIDIVLAVLLDKVREILHCARAFIFNWGVLSAGREELNGGEASNGVGDIVGRCVDFGDGNLRNILVKACKFLVFRGKSIQGLIKYSQARVNLIRGRREGGRGELTPCSVRTMVHKIREGHPSRCQGRDPYRNAPQQQ